MSHSTPRAQLDTHVDTFKAEMVAALAALPAAATPEQIVAFKADVTAKLDAHKAAIVSHSDQNYRDGLPYRQ